MKLNSMLSNFFSILNFYFNFERVLQQLKSRKRGDVYQMFEKFKFQNVKYPKHLKESMKSA